MKRWSLEIASAVVALGAVLLHLGFSGSISEPPELLLFLGRTHPMVVHLPIGSLVLVSLLELLVLLRRSGDVVDGALDLILPFAVVTALVAFGLGLFLAQDGGFSEDRLALHRRLALFAVVLSCAQAAIWFGYRRGRTSGARWLYRGAMVVALLALSAASHQGGTLSRGETYLSKYAPGFLKPLLGAADQETKPPIEHPLSSGAEPELFSAAVRPLLEKYCVECHGSETVKGGLRVDSLALLKRGGDAGTALVPFSGVQSLLVSRMLLPEDDDDRMPPPGRPAPTAGEIALIQFWVDRGAREDLKLRDLLAPTDARKSLERALSRFHSPSTGAILPSTKNSSKPTEEELSEESAEKSTSKEPLEIAEPKNPLGAQNDSSPPLSNAFAILQRRCAGCHGGSKQKGKLRVDSFNALERGGASGPAVVWGEPGASRLVQWMRLPLSHPDHMPPKKKPQLKAGEFAKIERWIAAKRPITSGSPGSLSRAKSSLEPNDFQADPRSTDEHESDSVDELERSDTLAACGAPSGDLPKGEVWLFDEFVGPLMRAKCGDCHTADLASGGLRLDSCPVIHEGGNEGPGVLPRVSAESPLLQRMQLPRSNEDHMPPQDYPQVTAEELSLVKVWIDEGATRSVTAPWERLPSDARERLLAQSPQRFAESEKKSAQRSENEAPPEVPAPRSGGFAGCRLSETKGESPRWFILLVLAFAIARCVRVARRPV